MFFFFKQKTAYEMRISDWSSDVCSSDLDEPWMPASEEPNPSVTRTSGNRSRIRALPPAESGAPPLEMAKSDDASQRPGSAASQASRSGFATASPTIVNMLGRSLDTRSPTFTGSSGPVVSTHLAPQNSHMSDVHCPA